MSETEGKTLRIALIGSVLLIAILGVGFGYLYNKYTNLVTEVSGLESQVDDLQDQIGDIQSHIVEIEEILRKEGLYPTSETPSEKVEILSAYAPLNTTGHYWNVTLVLKNTGSAEATLIDAYVNNVPIDQYSPAITWAWDDPSSGYTNVTDSITIESGQEVTVYLIILDPSHQTDPNYNFSSGTTINVKLHSAGGMDYIKLVELT